MKIVDRIPGLILGAALALGALLPAPAAAQNALETSRKACHFTVTTSATVEFQVNSSSHTGGLLTGSGCATYHRVVFRATDTAGGFAIYISTYFTLTEGVDGSFLFYGTDGEIKREWNSNVPIFIFHDAADPGPFDVQFTFED